MTSVPRPLCRCSRDLDRLNVLDVCALLLETFGFIANFTVTLILFLLRAKKIESLALLRVLSLSCLAATFVDFLSDVAARSSNTGNAFFDGLVCVLWSSRFIFWYSKAHVYHSLFFFACNRAFEMLQIKNYPMTTQKQRLTAYMLLVFICSFLSTAPQLLLAQPHVKNCACAPPTRNLVILTMIYAHTFLWVAILAVIYPAILVYICIALVLRARRSERGALVDELDQLYFPNSLTSSPSSSTTATSASSPLTHTVPCDGERNSSATRYATDDDSEPRIWSASFCLIPLSVTYIVTFSYDATYQFLSATGTITYMLRSPRQQFGEILLILFTALVPLIIFFHIPAMRSLIFVAIVALQKRCCKVKLTDAGDQSDLDLTSRTGQTAIP
ncbi:hypothetical protein AAHC03_021132 [Spirometra sp. Aus1]